MYLLENNKRQVLIFNVFSGTQNVVYSTEKFLRLCISNDRKVYYQDNKKNYYEIKYKSQD